MPLKILIEDTKGLAFILIYLLYQVTFIRDRIYGTAI